MSGGRTTERSTSPLEHARLRGGFGRRCGGATGSSLARTSADRAWGTVREDYSADGDAWRYFPFDHAHLAGPTAGGEDGLAGLCDREQRLCFALSFLERARPNPEGANLLASAGPEGNHGEDAKRILVVARRDPQTASWPSAGRLSLSAKPSFPTSGLRQEKREPHTPAARIRASGHRNI